MGLQKVQCNIDIHPTQIQCRKSSQYFFKQNIIFLVLYKLLIQTIHHKYISCLVLIQVSWSGSVFGSYLDHDTWNGVHSEIYQGNLCLIIFHYNVGCLYLNSSCFLSQISAWPSVLLRLCWVGYVMVTRWMSGIAHWLSAPSSCNSWNKNNY